MKKKILIIVFLVILFNIDVYAEDYKIKSIKCQYNVAFPSNDGVVDVGEVHIYYYDFNDGKNPKAHGGYFYTTQSGKFNESIVNFKKEAFNCKNCNSLPGASQFYRVVDNYFLDEYNKAGGCPDIYAGFTNYLCGEVAASLDYFIDSYNPGGGYYLNNRSSAFSELHQLYSDDKWYEKGSYENIKKKEPRVCINEISLVNVSESKYKLTSKTEYDDDGKPYSYSMFLDDMQDKRIGNWNGKKISNDISFGYGLGGKTILVSAADLQKIFDDNNKECITLYSYYTNQDNFVITSDYDLAMKEASFKDTVSESVEVTESSNDKENDYESGNKVVANCKGIIGDELLNILSKYYRWILIITPILVIVLCSMDFFKAIMASDDQAIKKATKSATTRLIALVILFFIPFFLKLLFSMPGLDGIVTSTCDIENNDTVNNGNNSTSAKDSRNRNNTSNSLNRAIPQER